jgi:hypothetical protein
MEDSREDNQDIEFKHKDKEFFKWKKLEIS